MSKKPEVKKENKIDTHYYDDLFMRLKNPDSDEFKEQENLDIFYENIIDDISQKDIELKKCLYSYHIDYFIYKSSLEHCLKILELIINDKLEEYLADRRISRAYEACLLTIGQKVASNSNSNTIESVKQLLEKLGDYLVENFEQILDTENGIFCLRCFLRIIGEEDSLEQANIQQQNTNVKKKFNNKEFNIRNVGVKQIPNEWKFKKFIKKLSKHLFNLNLLEIGLAPSKSPCASLLLRKLKSSYSDIAADLVNKIHEQFVKKASSFHSMIQDAIGSRFIETYLLIAPSNLLKDFYFEKNLLPNLIAYSKHIYANYPIQTLLKYRLEDDPDLRVLYDSLVENLSSIIDLHSDLIYKNFILIELISLCSKSKTYDLKELVKVIMNFFGCDADEKKKDFLRVLLAYEKLDDVIKEGPADQALFLFDIKPTAVKIANTLIESDEKQVIKCFNNLTANELEHLCTDNVGSHFVQQTLKTFNSKDRTVQLQSIYDKLKGRLNILSTNKNGSFVIESLWSLANLKQRTAIVDELKVCEPQLKNDQYGRFVVTKFGLSFYKRRPDEWKEIQTNEFKKRKMFADLLDDTTNEKKKIKK